MNAKKTMLIFAALCFLSASVYLYAVDDPAVSERETRQQKDVQKEYGQKEGRAEKMSHDKMAGLETINKLMDKDITNSQGESLGSVEEVILDSNNDRVAYIILSVDDNLHPIPFTAFKKSGDQCMIDITKDQLKSAPKIDSLDVDDLQQLSSTDFRKNVSSFYSKQMSSHQQKWEKWEKESGTQERLERGSQRMQEGMESGQERMEQGAQRIEEGVETGQQAIRQGTTGAQGTQQRSARDTERSQQRMAQPFDTESSMQLYKASDVIGLDVQNMQGDQIASIDDIVVETHYGTIAYGLVSYGGVVGIGDEIAAVPWASLEITPDQDFAKLDATQEQLSLAAVDEDNIAQLSESDFARQIHDNFQAEPYWEVFGFAPGQTSEQFAQTWGPDSAYNRNFKPDNMQTVSGTIRSVGSFSPARDASRGLSLNVQTDKGESITVYAGPRDFAMKQNLDLTSGQKVTVTGSKTTVNDKDVIMASELKVGDKTLKLRDEQGKPLWKMDQPQQQQQQQKGTQDPQKRMKDKESEKSY